jgi:hypothetical protein
MTGSFHTLMGPYLLDLIDFIEEKINEALQHPISANAALEEAFGAFAPIKDRLTKEENDPLIMVLVLLGIFNPDLNGADLNRMDTAQLNAFIVTLQDARNAVARFAP